MSYKTISLQAVRDEAFFQNLGQRVAELRQRRGFTQVEVAEQLSIKQQAFATYERASRRLPCSLLLPLCEVLQVNLDELLGVEPAKGKPGPVPRIQRQFEAILQLPKAEQRFFSEMMERFLRESEAA